MVAAYVRRTRPAAPSVAKLSLLSYDYLRLDICLAEALSNFERRPLRQSQLHYIFTLAWCPVAILRALCSYRVVQFDKVESMMLRVGFSGPQAWDDSLRNVCFSSEPDVEVQMEGMTGIISGSYGVNCWKDPNWREKVPMPDPTFDVAKCIK